MPGTHPPIFWLGDVNRNILSISLRTFGYSRLILAALRSLSLKPISFGYKTPPIRFSQAGGQSAHSQGSSPQPSTRVDIATQWATSCWLTVVVQRPAASLCRARTSSLSRGCSAARPTCMTTPAAVVTRSGAHRLAPGTTHAACATTPPVGLTSVRRATKARSAYKHVSHLRHCVCRSLYRSTCEYPSTAAGTPCVCVSRRDGRLSWVGYKHVPHRDKPPHLVARRNARERRRVQAVNSAFLRLRRHLPHPVTGKHKRLSKVQYVYMRRACLQLSPCLRSEL